MEYYAIVNSKSFEHYGTPGQKWGVRRAEWYPIEKYREHLQSMGYDERTINRKMRKAERGETKYRKQVAKNRAKSLAKAQEAKRIKNNAKGEVNENLKEAVNKELHKGRYPYLSGEAHKKAIDAAAKVAKEKEEIIRKGDINAALKRIDEFSNEELRMVMDRDKAVTALAKAKTDKLASNMGTVMDVTNKAANIASNAINVYNNIAKIANSLGDANLPYIKEMQQAKNITEKTIDMTKGIVTEKTTDKKGNTLTVTKLTDEARLAKINKDARDAKTKQEEAEKKSKQDRYKNKQAAISAYKNGESMADIADKLGISSKTVSELLGPQINKDWYSTQTSRSGNIRTIQSYKDEQKSKVTPSRDYSVKELEDARNALLNDSYTLWENQRNSKTFVGPSTPKNTVKEPTVNEVISKANQFERMGFYESSKAKAEEEYNKNKNK